jgi:hypothetical protein
MSTFDINRFGQALKCQFVLGRKLWIRLFGIFTLVLFMAGLFWTRVQGTNYDYMLENWSADDLYRNYNHDVEQTVFFGVIFFCFSMLFGASFLFSQMKDTRKRSAFLLWPVSNLEKYVVNLLLSIFWLAIITVGAYVLADTLRVFVDWATGRIVIWGFPKLADPFGNNAAFEYWQSAWMFFTWVFYIHSLYIVGGTLFRRQQFLLTSMSIIIVGFLLISFLSHMDLHIHFIDGTWDEKTRTYTRTFYPFFYILNTTLCALVVFHYWASYKLFTRMQVINNKWLNV